MILHELWFGGGSTEYYLLTVDSTAKGRKLTLYRSDGMNATPDRACLLLAEGWKWQDDWKFLSYLAPVAQGGPTQEADARINQPSLIPSVSRPRY